MDIYNTDMIKMWEYLEDLEDLIRGKEDLKCLEEMQDSAQNAVDMQIELGETIAEDFIKLNVEAEMILKQITGDPEFKFEGN